MVEQETAAFHQFPKKLMFSKNGVKRILFGGSNEAILGIRANKLVFVHNIRNDSSAERQKFASLVPDGLQLVFKEGECSIDNDVAGVFDIFIYRREKCVSKHASLNKYEIVEMPADFMGSVKYKKFVDSCLIGASQIFDENEYNDLVGICYGCEPGKIKDACYYVLKYKDLIVSYIVVVKDTYYPALLDSNCHFVALCATSQEFQGRQITKSFLNFVLNKLEPPLPVIGCVMKYNLPSHRFALSAGFEFLCSARINKR